MAMLPVTRSTSLQPGLEGPGKTHQDYPLFRHGQKPWAPLALGWLSQYFVVLCQGLAPEAQASTQALSSHGVSLVQG